MAIPGKYKIVSRSMPDKIMFIGTSADIPASIKWHMHHLIFKMHPVPELQNHVIKYGIEDFDFRVEPIEVAVIEVKKETRRKKSV